MQQIGKGARCHSEAIPHKRAKARLRTLLY